MSGMLARVRSYMRDTPEANDNDIKYYMLITQGLLPDGLTTWDQYLDIVSECIEIAKGELKEASNECSSSQS